MATKKSHGIHVSGLDIIRKNVIFHLNFLVSLSAFLSIFSAFPLLPRISFFLEQKIRVCLYVCATLSSLPVTVENRIRNKTQDECIKSSRCFHEIHSCCSVAVAAAFMCALILPIYVCLCVFFGVHHFVVLP